MASQEVLTALETLHREIEKLEPAIKHVESAQQVTQILKAIPQKHVELLQEVKSNDAKYKEELKNLFAKELSGFTEENKKLQKTTTEIQQQVKLEQEALTKLKGTVQSFYERVEKINFPERLDKLDANVAGIMAAIQSVQSRLDGLERNISDRLRDMQDYQKETRAEIIKNHNEFKATLQASTDNFTKKQRTLSFITWILIAIMCTVIILLVRK
jgi:chromosome segregation ATPase